jgi:hypothetical protein
MSDEANSSGAGPAVGSLEALVARWDEFRGGAAVPCARDGGALALSVDPAAGVYRFVCVQCGAPSAWFESGPAGLKIRVAAAIGAIGAPLDE